MNKSRWDQKNVQVTHKKQGNEKEMKNRNRKQTMADSSPNTSTITFNVNDLIIPVKKWIGRAEKNVNLKKLHM